ncbi:MAG: thioredoxin family protein [Fidelibacterota bacterium]|nr:MAG: thioredoxin family protein [Candidatus Neomarinimicrobiota bacterium]
MSQNCAPEVAVHGQFFPELANPTGGPTLVLFFTEHLDFTTADKEYSRTSNHTDYLIKQIQLVLTQLAQMRPDLRILAVDVSENRHIAADHRVYRIPELILFSSTGHELRRWTPDDFNRGGGTLSEIQDRLERIEVQDQKAKD